MLPALKKLFDPSVPWGFSTGFQVTMFVITFILAWPIFFFAAGKQQFDGRLHAETGPVHGVAYDLWADIVLGQTDFNQQVPGEIVPFKVAGPGGVWVDKSVQPNRIYVFDGMNSRILGYQSLGVCSNDPNIACSSNTDCPGASCSIQLAGENSLKTADIVIGQAGFNTSTCNQSSTITPITPASASSLCSMPSTFSPYEYGSFSSPVTDSSGNLFVADPFNNRILKYNSPFTTDTVADEVWGQDNFGNIFPNKGSSLPDATTLSLINSSPNQKLTIAVDLDAQGNLWASDPNNNRVLRYPNIGGTISKTADLVLGQPNFTSRNPGAGLNQLYNPTGVRVNPVNGSVWVADTENNRILIYSSPFSTGMSGQTFGTGFRTPTDITFQLNPDNTTLPLGIWVNDTNNHQLVMFDNNANVIKVLHKNAYANNGVCTYYCDSRGSIGITVDGDIISAASSNAQNVAYFKHPIPLNGSGTYYAQYYFYSPPAGVHNYISGKGFTSPRGIAISSNQLIMADSDRILFWNIPHNQICLC